MFSVYEQHGSRRCQFHTCWNKAQCVTCSPLALAPSRTSLPHTLHLRPVCSPYPSFLCVNLSSLASLPQKCPLCFALSFPSVYHLATRSVCLLLSLSCWLTDSTLQKWALFLLLHWNCSFGSGQRSPLCGISLFFSVHILLNYFAVVTVNCTVVGIPSPFCDASSSQYSVSWNLTLSSSVLKGRCFLSMGSFMVFPAAPLPTTPFSLCLFWKACFLLRCIVSYSGIVDISTLDSNNRVLENRKLSYITVKSVRWVNSQ